MEKLKSQLEYYKEDLHQIEGKLKLRYKKKLQEYNNKFDILNNEFYYYKKINNELKNKLERKKLKFYHVRSINYEIKEKGYLGTPQLFVINSLTHS